MAVKYGYHGNDKYLIKLLPINFSEKVKTFGGVPSNLVKAISVCADRYIVVL